MLCRLPISFRTKGLKRFFRLGAFRHGPKKRLPANRKKAHNLLVSFLGRFNNLHHFVIHVIPLPRSKFQACNPWYRGRPFCQTWTALVASIVSTTIALKKSRDLIVGGVRDIEDQALRGFPGFGIGGFESVCNLDCHFVSPCFLAADDLVIRNQTRKVNNYFRAW
jgi:hypothetical protein